MADFLRSPRTFEQTYAFFRATGANYHGPNGILLAAGIDEKRIEPDGLLLESNSENFALWNRDFTNAAWVNTSVTVNIDQVGIDGTSNSANRLFTASGSFGRIRQNITIGDNTNINCFSVYIKKTTNATTNPVMRIFYSGGSALATLYAIDTDNGTTRPVDGSSLADKVQVEDYGDYWRVAISYANNGSGNTTAEAAIWPAAVLPGSDVLDALIDGECIVDYAQFEQQRLNPTSAIFNTSITATRLNDICPISDNGFMNVPNDVDSFTVETEFKVYYGNNLDSVFFSLDGASASNKLEIRQAGTGTGIEFAIVVNGGTEYVTPVFNVPEQTFAKFAATYNKRTGQFIFAVNGETHVVQNSQYTELYNIVAIRLLNRYDDSPFYRAFIAKYKTIKFKAYYTSISEMVSITS